MIAKMALLAVGGREYALPVDRIRHILADAKVFPLVCLRSGFAGVFLFDNEVVPQLQHEALAEEHATSGLLPYMVICQSDFGEVGLPIDHAVRIVDAGDGQLSPAPPDSEPAMITQLFIRHGESYPLLDIDTLLAQLPYS